MLGVDPANYTLRELVCMLDGKYIQNYNIASYLASIIINVHASHGHTVEPNDVNPYKRDVVEDNNMSGVDFLAQNAESLGIKVVHEALKI